MLKKNLLILFILVAATCFLVASPLLIDRVYQREFHNKMMKLHKDILIGMDVEEVQTHVSHVKWDPKRVKIFKNPHRIALFSPRKIFPQNAWTLVIEFTEEDQVRSVRIGSMDSMSSLPRGAPHNKGPTQ